MIDKLQISPAPSADEAAAIAAALSTLLAQRNQLLQPATQTASLRYQDVASGDIPQRQLTWNALARLESFDV